MILPYSRKIWRGIKFGGLAVYITTAKLKSAKISYSHIYVWRSHTKPPNLNPPIFLQLRFWAQPPHLIPANISGYTVYAYCFSLSPPTSTLRKQLAFMLGRQQVFLELDETECEEVEDIADIMSNVHLNNNFLALAREVRRQKY